MFGISVIIEVVNVVIGIVIFKGCEWLCKVYVVMLVFGFVFLFINMLKLMFVVLIFGFLLFVLFIYLLFWCFVIVYFWYVFV